MNTDVPLGIISCGTGNDIIRPLKIPKDPLEALRHAIPLTGAEARRGKAASPGWRLGSRSPDFAYQNQAGGGPVDVWEIQSAMRLELERRYREAAAREAAAGPGTVAILSADLVAALPGEAQLTEALAAADLVLCQTGCLSHDDYWRVQDYCARSGKRCLLLAKEDAPAPAPARAAAD